MHQTSSRLSVMLVSLITLLALSLPSLAQQPNLFFAGYVQSRFSETFGDDDGSEFDVKRAYFVVIARPADDVTAVVNMWLYPDPRLLEAYGQYNFDDDLYARLGLTAIPFGYENPLSSARLVTLERSQVSMALIYPYSFDTGLFVYALDLPADFALSTSITNGRPVDIPGNESFRGDNNADKTFVARLSHPIPSGEIGASYWDGELPSGDEAERLGADLQWYPGPFTVLAEYITGEDADVEKDGYYVTVGYQPEGSDFQPFLRYDTFDNEGVAGDYARITGGVNYFVNPKTKVTLQYESIDNEETAPDVDGALTLQYQVVF